MDRRTFIAAIAGSATSVTAALPVIATTKRVPYALNQVFEGGKWKAVGPPGGWASIEQKRAEWKRYAQCTQAPLS